VSTIFRTIHIHAEAPVKPAWGAACNGCGVCCLAEPCPVGMVLSVRRRGTCVALVWDSVAAKYRCGAVVQPGSILALILPPWAGWMRHPLSIFLRWVAPRWIAAGTGCDSTLEAQSASGTM